MRQYETTPAVLDDLGRLALDMREIARRFNDLTACLSADSLDRMTDNQWLRHFAPYSVADAIEYFTTEERTRTKLSHKGEHSAL